MERRPMATSYPDEIDALLAELGASLTRSQRIAFEAAARSALAAAGCSGCGAAYRVLAPLQRSYWDPPSDERRADLGARRYGGRPSKLASLEPIGSSDPREDGRARNRLKAV